MKNVFLIFLCASLFKLHSMEINRIDLNSLPDELFTDHILPVIILGWHGAISGSNDGEKLYNAVQIVKNQDPTFQKAIAYIRLINKRFYAMVVPHYTEMKELINNIENSTKMYSLLGLLNCFELQALQPITIAFKRTNEWWNIEKKQLMQVQFSYNISQNNYINININCKKATEFPCIFNTYLPQESDVKIVNSAENVFFTQLSAITYVFHNNAEYKYAHGSAEFVPAKEHVKILQYFFNSEQCFSAQDGVLLCLLAQKISFLKKKSELPKNDFELLCQKFKNLF